MKPASEQYKGFDIHVAAPEPNGKWQGSIPALRRATSTYSSPTEALADARRIVEAHIAGTLPAA
jgi:hypothetical protein